MRELFSYIGNSRRDISANVFDIHSLFREFGKVLPDISKAIRVFQQNDVDPWYAQTILLIESPGKTRQVFRSSDVREKSAAPGEFISNPPRGFTRAGLVSGDFGRWCSEDCDKNVFALMRRT